VVLKWNGEVPSMLYDDGVDQKWFKDERQSKAGELTFCQNLQSFYIYLKLIRYYRNMNSIFTLLILLASISSLLASENGILSKIGDKDAIVVVKLTSTKPSKVTIYNCTVTKTYKGDTTKKTITMSFLHFPDCKRLELGKSYLCAIRHGSGSGYELIRSDMLSKDKETKLVNYAWEINSPEAKQLVETIKMQNKSQ
jgi:hypothetical protein